MMTKAHRQESLSLAYVQAVAACCGLGVGSRQHDYGMDLTLFEIGDEDGGLGESGRKLDLQLKSSTAAVVGPHEVLYDLEVRAYKRLRRPDAVLSRLLVVLILPPDEADWVNVSEAELSLRRCAYWGDLRGLPPTTNTASVRVALPRANVFSPDQVLLLFQQIPRGQQP
jgi:hypothetical protein